MKSYKNIFRKAIALLPLCLMSWMLILSSCSQEEQELASTNKRETLRFNLFDANEVKGSRATTDGQSMITTFELADKAGLYAVKGGQVVLDNIVLTYNSSGFWESENPIDADELSGAQFYAYYPYQASALFDASSATPFAQMVNADVAPAKQNTKVEYEAADIMITAATSVGSYNTVSLALQHQKSMVCIELPNSSYIFTNEGMTPYVMAKAEDAQFTLNGSAVQPFFDESSQSYRLIVEPGQEGSLKVSFTNHGESRTYETATLSSLEKGQYAKFIVDGGAQLVNMTLEVGDYYCADGRIVKKDSEVLPENIIGVVFKVGTTEAICTANANWSHGVVISLAEIRSKWGTNSSTTSEQNAAGWRYWYRDYGLADQNGVTSAAKLDETLMVEEGYETTAAWRAVPQPLTIGGFTLDYTSLMNSTLDTWIDSHPLPNAICSGWYIPSLRDWINIEGQSGVLSTQLKAVGGTDLLWNTGSSNNYWSCNVRAAGSNWCYVGKKTSLSDRYKGVACTSNANYRFLLAF